MSLEVKDVHHWMRIDRTLEGCKPFMYLIVHLRHRAGQYCVIHLVSAKRITVGVFLDGNKVNNVPNDNALSRESSVDVTL